MEVESEPSKGCLHLRERMLVSRASRSLWLRSQVFSRHLLVTGREVHAQTAVRFAQFFHFPSAFLSRLPPLESPSARKKQSIPRDIRARQSPTFHSRPRRPVSHSAAVSPGKPFLVQLLCSQQRSAGRRVG